MYQYDYSSIFDNLIYEINDTIQIVDHLPSKEFLDVLLLKDYKTDQRGATQLQGQESYSSAYLKNTICYVQK